MYRFYEDKVIAKFIKDNFGNEVYGRYALINPSFGAARADLFRYLCIYACGAIYLDAKADVSRPIFQSVLPDDESIASR